MPLPIEVERKFLFDGREGLTQAFNLISSKYPLIAPYKRSTLNLVFDTPDGLLRARNSSVRFRGDVHLMGGEWVYKAPKPAGSPDERIEVTEPAVNPLCPVALQRLRDTVGLRGVPLVELFRFTTERQGFALVVDDFKVDVCLDEVTYPDGTKRFEVEFEVPNRPGCLDVFNALGMPWQETEDDKVSFWFNRAESPRQSAENRPANHGQLRPL